MQQSPSIPELKSVHVKDARLYANRRDALESWPKNSIVAEIGVAFGDFSERILDVVKPELFDAYDIFQYHKSDVAWGRSSAETFKGKTHCEFYENRFADYISERKMRVYEGSGRELISNREQSFYDVIYVDADHKYDSVMLDAEAAIRCLKQDGLLVFNDYILYDHKSNTSYGIVPVVNQLCASGEWRIQYFALQREMFCDIALIRA